MKVQSFLIISLAQPLSDWFVWVLLLDKLFKTHRAFQGILLEFVLIFLSQCLLQVGIHHLEISYPVYVLVNLDGDVPHVVPQYLILI